MNKVPQDNREFIEALKKYGDVVHIEQEVDWDLEAGAIVRRVCELNSPAPFMERIKDYPGFRYLGAPLATYRRLAIALGLEPGLSVRELAQEYLRRTEGKPVEPVLIDRSSAPCKENILLGKEADLCCLPAPMVHDGDGGRYLGTWHAVVSRDPETGLVNWGMYRQMVYDAHTLVGAVFPQSDLGKLFRKLSPRGEPIPFATVIGPPPASGVAASAPSPIPEPELTGMLTGEPMELVPCETVPLEVPARSEVVIEGVILPDVQLEEGPFGEYTGYRTSPRMPRMVFLVQAITYRDNPILTISNMGVPTDEGQLLRSFTLALELEKLLRSQGLPVTGVYMPPESTHHLVIVGVKPIYNNIATQIANLAFGAKSGHWYHMAIVVDDTVDIYNMKEVIHALCTRCHPVRGIRVHPHAVATPLYPFLSPEERRTARGAQVLFDCTFPLEWDPLNDVPPLVSFRTVYPKEIQEKVLSQWKAYGFPS